MEETICKMLGCRVISISNTTRITYWIVSAFIKLNSNRHQFLLTVDKEQCARRTQLQQEKINGLFDVQFKNN